MKKIFSTLLCAVALCAFASCSKEQTKESIKVISYNIRCGVNPGQDGENNWEYRKQASINMINDEKPTIFGLQEALPPCPGHKPFLPQPEWLRHILRLRPSS